MSRFLLVPVRRSACAGRLRRAPTAQRSTDCVAEPRYVQRGEHEQRDEGGHEEIGHRRSSPGNGGTGLG